MTKAVYDIFMENGEDTQKDKYLIFILANEFYGIDIKYVIEIIGIQPISKIPELPEYIKGIINLRGKIIPIMDVRLRFKEEYREYNNRTCIVVIEVEDVTIGLVVDSVLEVVDIPDFEIVEPPEIGNHKNRFIKGIGKSPNSIKLLLDCNKLLSDEEVNIFSDNI
ncbi:MAG TPA: chemotaxis protein CheW [Clostridium sp.]|jgi:purine-binding chemotaxis protein CheW|uniref:chemotaxis protein CheW n=1 Tax=Clostridium sp. TaxID=1506 RepID=UPI000E95C429|nr:chemotaxis protein CheW [Clostridium sp.]